MIRVIASAVMALAAVMATPVAVRAQEVVSRNATPSDVLVGQGAAAMAAATADQSVVPAGLAGKAQPDAQGAAPVDRAPDAQPAPAEPPQIVLSADPGLMRTPLAGAPQPLAPGEVPLINLGLTPASAPMAGAGKLDGAAPPQVLPAAPPPAPQQAPGEWLMPLIAAPGAVSPGVVMGAGMSQPGVLRLTGEVADLDLRVTLPIGTAPTLPLVLALRSSINNLPEGSVIAVRVNGVDAGVIPLDHIGPFAARQIEVAGLVPGANVIRLSARQTHRIFCGPEASFGIWTEIDLAQSGIPVAASLMPLDPSGLIAALQSQGAGNRPIDVLADEATSPAIIRAVARQLGAALGFVPQLRVLPFHSDQIDQGARARVALIPGADARATVRRGATGATVLQIEHTASGLPDLSGLLPVWDQTASVPKLTPGVKTPLSALGTPQIIANTQYFRRDLNFVLPDDWLLLASQKAEFEIVYGFASGLPEGGLLLFKVNGQTVRLLPLDREGGKILPPLRISFLASRLHAGVNTLTFEASVPGDPTDMPCVARDTDMLVILGDSALTVPPSPSMHQNDLARSLAMLDGADVTIPAAGAATDILSARDLLIAFGARFRPLMDAPLRPVLHVVGLDGLGMIPLGDSPVSRRALQHAVSWRPEAPPVAASTTPAAVMVPKAEPFRLSVEALDTTLAAATPPEEQAPSWFGRIAAWAAPEGWVTSVADTSYKAAFPGSVPLEQWLGEHQGQALLIQLDPATPDDVWLLAGPQMDTATLVQKLDAFRRDGSHGSAAQAAVLRADGTWATWSQNRAPRLLEPLTFGNIRDVLGNYASWSPGLFTSLAFFLALLSVFPSAIFVMMSRRPGSRT